MKRLADKQIINKKNPVKQWKYRVLDQGSLVVGEGVVQIFPKREELVCVVHPSIASD